MPAFGWMFAGRGDGSWLTAAEMSGRAAKLPRSRGRLRRWIDRGWVLWAYLALNVPLALAVALEPRSVSLVFRAVIATLALFALVVGVRWQRPGVPAAWRLLAAGTAVSAAATWAGAVRVNTGGTAPPGEWSAPVLLALAFLPFVAGLALLPASPISFSTPWARPGCPVLR